MPVLIDNQQTKRMFLQEERLMRARVVIGKVQLDTISYRSESFGRPWVLSA
jgi:hypothetical protein